MYRHSLTVHFFYKLIYVTIVKIQSVQKPIQVPYSPVKYSEISIISVNGRPRKGGGGYNSLENLHTFIGISRSALASHTIVQLLLGWSSIYHGSCLPLNKGGQLQTRHTECYIICYK